MERGRHSLLSRARRDRRRTRSTLKPFGAWWFWVLALALVTRRRRSAVLAARCAPRSTTTPRSACAAARARRGRPPRAARAARRASRAGRSLAAVGALVAAAGSRYWSLDTHVFQNDEDQYVYLSRWLQTDFPASLFDFAAYGRGLQRLEVWLLAIPSALFDSPWSLRGGRVLNTIAFVSTAIPVYLLGRAAAAAPAVGGAAGGAQHRRAVGGRHHRRS